MVLALQILSCGKQLQVWGGKAGAATYYDMIARDKEIVKVVLLLTGSIEGTKESVLEYISSFDKYKFLWQKDLATEYAAFMSTSPSLEVTSLLCLVTAIYCCCLYSLSSLYAVSHEPPECESLSLIECHKCKGSKTGFHLHSQALSLLSK